MSRPIVAVLLGVLLSIAAAQVLLDVWDSDSAFAFALVPFAVVPVLVTMLVFGRDQTIAAAVSCVGVAWCVNACLVLTFLALISADGT